MLCNSNFVLRKVSTEKRCNMDLDTVNCKLGKILQQHLVNGKKFLTIRNETERKN